MKFCSHLIFQLSLIDSPFILVCGVPDVVVDGLLNTLVGLEPEASSGTVSDDGDQEPDLRISDKDSPDLARLGSSRGATTRTTKGKGILEILG